MNINQSKAFAVKKEFTKEEILEQTKSIKYCGLGELDCLSVFLYKAIKGDMQYKIGKDALINNYNIVRDIIAEIESFLGDDL